MKRILLASASIVAFAGAAAAEVTFGGEATLGYNDTVEEDFYWEADLGVTMTQELNNGVIAGATFNLNISEDNLGDTVVADSFVLSLTTDMGGLYFGDVDPVADSEWGGVDGSAVADFNDQDVHFDPPVSFEAILRGEVMFGGIEGFVSFGVDTDGVGLGDDIDAMQLVLNGSFGAFNGQLAYQEAFAGADDILGVSVGTSFAGADVILAYETDQTETSIGVGASYPIGPVTVGGYYTSNDIADDSYGVSADYASGPIAVSAFYDVEFGNDGDFGVEGSYDVGSGIMVMAGVIDNGDAYYVAGTYDLGGGASLLVSYADDENDPLNDEIGDPEYMAGITAELSLEF